MSCVLFYSFSSVESQGEGHANHVYALLPKTVKQLPLAVAMWLHPLMNPCQFPACSRQLRMQRAHSPRPAPLSVFPSRHRAASSLHTLDLPHCLHEDCIFACPSLSPSLSHTLFLPSCHSVHCPLSIGHCPLSVCRVPVCQRDTFHSCSWLGFRLCSAPFVPPSGGSAPLPHQH